MPTSSQALILKVTDGYLPPVFRRRYWRPAHSDLYPLTSIYVPERPQQPQDRKEPAFTPGSSHTIKYDYHYPSLPDVLHIQGIKGSLEFDSTNNSFNYEVDSLPKTRIDNWTEVPDTLTVYRHAHPGSTRDASTTAPTTYRQNGTNRANMQHYKRGPHLRRQHKFVKMDASGEVVQLPPADQSEADFFKLVKVPDTENNQKENVQNFRLIKTSPLERGAFRLAKTDHVEVGEFYLVPPEGCESDDFRLAKSEYPGCFTVLQSDHWTPDTFKALKSENVHGNEFRLVSAKIRNTPVSNPGRCHRNDDLSDGDIDMLHDNRPSDTQFTQRRHSHTKDKVHDSHMRYDYFDEILKEEAQSRETMNKRFSLPEIMNDPSKRLHDPVLVRHRHVGEDPYEFNAEEFAAKYMEDIRDNSAEVYERLVNLGFRRSPDDTDHPRFSAKTGDGTTGSDGKLHSCDWRMCNFDKWTRTTEATQSKQALMSVESSKLMHPGGHQPTEETHKASLLEELKTNSNYKLWKKKKSMGIRMRKELPPEDPTAVCLSLKDNAIAHDVLLQQVQKATGNQLTSLQFDPVSVHSQDSDVKSQWILRFSDETVCDDLLNVGINILGTNYQVRKFNDVMKDEHEAYKFSVIMQKYKEHKLKEKQAEKRKSSKKLKTTQTQTPS